MNDDIMFLCIKPARPVAIGGFINQDFDWNVMPEEGMTGIWLLPESLEEPRLTLKAKESPLEKWLGTLSGCVVHGSLSREGTKVAFLKEGKEEPQDTTGTSRT